MKRKIKLTDKLSGQVLTSETEIRNLDHFAVQLNSRATVFADKRKKQPKHKPDYLIED